MFIYSLCHDMWSVLTLGISCNAPEGANKQNRATKLCAWTHSDEADQMKPCHEVHRRGACPLSQGCTTSKE